MAYSNESEIIYAGRDNSFIKQLLIDKVPADLSGVTRMVFKLGTVAIDSLNYPTAFDWSIGLGRVEIKLGGIPEIAGDEGPPAIAPSIAPGNYMCTLIVFDANYPNGLVWAEDIRVVVKSGV